MQQDKLNVYSQNYLVIVLYRHKFYSLAKLILVFQTCQIKLPKATHPGVGVLVEFWPPLSVTQRNALESDALRDR